MAFVDSIKRVPGSGARRLGHAVRGYEPPWTRRRRHRSRLKWAVGFALGLLAIAGIVLYAINAGLFEDRD